MGVFVFYSTKESGDVCDGVEEFLTRAEALRFIDEQARGRGDGFSVTTVIEGRELELEPFEVAVRHRFKG